MAAAAKGKELNTAEKLRQLYELQLVDSELDELQNMKGELPVEVNDLEDEIAGLETRQQKAETANAEMDGEIKKQRDNIKTNEGMIERYKKQLDNVKNNREFDALNKEIELQSLDIQLAEKRIREAQRNIESKKEVVDATHKRLEQKKKELDSKRVELQKILEKTEKEEEKLRKKTDKARKGIDDRLLKSYDRIRHSYRNGLAVVSVLRNACGGCFNHIPPQLQLEITLHKKVIACEHCGRILVDDSIMEVEVAEA
jgi:uncharacterized protein